MANHINTPTGDTKTHNPTLHLTPMPVLFKAGDTVLCPSVGSDVYTLAQHGDTVNFKHKVYFVDGEGETQIFRPDGTEYKGGEQVIFHDTPANRRAISQLFQVFYYYPTPEYFEIGDTVLSPFAGNGVYRVEKDNLGCLYIDPLDPKKDFISIDPNGNHLNHSTGKIVFHDTPANRQAIAMLYGIEYPTAKKLPLFKGGQHGNALGQIIFTPDEWDLLKHALADYIADIGGVDNKEAYQVLSERISNQETSEPMQEGYTDNGKHYLNLYCYDRWDVKTLILVALSVSYLFHTHNPSIDDTILDSLYSKIQQTLDDITADLIKNHIPTLCLTIQHDDDYPLLESSISLLQTVAYGLAGELGYDD